MRAVIEVSEDHELILKEVYSGIRLETRDGNAISVCMRDDTLEISVLPKDGRVYDWWRVNMQKGTIERMRAGPIVSDTDPVAPPEPGDG